MGNLLDAIKHYVANATKEDITADWEMLKEYNEYGPYVDGYLQKNPCYSFNKKVEKCNTTSYGCSENFCLAA